MNLPDARSAKPRSAIPGINLGIDTNSVIPIIIVMDISILLALQNFRNGVGAFLAPFLKFMTFFGEVSTSVFLLAIIYWCVSKEFGTYLMLGWSSNRLVNGFLKVTFCAYRPWIRDARIIPHGNSIETATGYSFPSGHTTNASSIFGGSALRKEIPVWGKVVLIVAALLVGFSRNYLGVHTPQDVLVGFSCSLLVMFFILKLTAYLEKNPEKDMLVMWIGLAIALALGLYAGLKSYPEDYNEQGKLIVDGAKMAKDTFKAIGLATGFLTGWVLERRFVRFTSDVSISRRIIRGVIGGGVLAVLLYVVTPWIDKLLPGFAGPLVSRCIQMFFVTFLFPWCLKLVGKKD